MPFYQIRRSDAPPPSNLAAVMLETRPLETIVAKDVPLYGLGLRLRQAQEQAGNGIIRLVGKNERFMQYDILIADERRTVQAGTYLGTVARGEILYSNVQAGIVERTRGLVGNGQRATLEFVPENGEYNIFFYAEEPAKKDD